ncbi:MAG: hypothetical protein M5U32_20460 [Myxococcota bacterium]|nr:hypothetical protein [Myxococcota bacterium]
MSRGALQTLSRALRFVAPLRGRVAIKMALLLVSVLPLVLVPWPGKIVIDHVIEGLPVDPAAYPFFIRPFTVWIAGDSAVEILGWTLLAQLVLLVLVGAFGASGRERDEADAWLAGGHDTQTRTENEANAGFSLAGGLLGFLDLRYTMRLTQDLNHHFRSVLFRRLQALPMRAFDEERIGDAVYRVMIDTPSITTACWRILLTPIGAPAAIGTAAAALYLGFGEHPALMWGRSPRCRSRCWRHFLSRHRCAGVRSRAARPARSRRRRPRRASRRSWRSRASAEAAASAGASTATRGAASAPTARCCGPAWRRSCWACCRAGRWPAGPSSTRSIW